MISEIIDLTYDMYEGMLKFGADWHVPFSMSQVGRHDVEGRETRKVTFGTHTGTQIDAPLHFIKNGASIEQVGLSKLVGEVSIFDFTHVPEYYVIQKRDLQKLKLSSRVIFRYGWQSRWPTKDYYSGYPCFSEDAAKYLVENGVQLLGFDCPSPDDSRLKLSGDLLGSKEDSPIHKILLGNGVVLAEYLTNLDKVKDLAGWSIAALPLRLKGADGSPARIILFR